MSKLSEKSLKKSDSSNKTRESHEIFNSNFQITRVIIFHFFYFQVLHFPEFCI